MCTVLTPMSFWFHDLASCLHDCIGTVLLYHGKDPILTLGASWEFHCSPRDLSYEEFYYPSSRPSLAESLMPFHPVRSAWHRSDDAEAAWEAVKAAVGAGQPVIVAEDNFYIPFRPAFGDVHAAHLLVMYGFDEEAGQVYLLDSTPPTFQGAIGVHDFLAARGSTVPREGENDYFYSGTPIANRWLRLEIDAGFPELTRVWVSEVIAANLRRFRETVSGEAFSGLDGLRRYLRGVCERAGGAEGGRALEELHVVAYAYQAEVALHAEFLMAAGRRLGWHGLAEVGRQVDLLAGSWTGLRMLGGHGFVEGLDVVDRVALRAAQLVLDQERVLDRLKRTITLDLD
jgi:Butirosin biosynthesis protein H, N-terminal